MNAPLRSPVTGATLVHDAPHALRDAEGRRWPVVDGIPFLRAGREELAREALAHLDAGRDDEARVLLLGDQDDWWSGPTPCPGDLRVLVRERAHLSLRNAMAALAFGRVGDYFAHRWSDPTFLAGLALIEAHRGPAASAFELACGIGHYGREMLRRGVDYTGADVVFAKLWLARGWVTGEAARLVCFDAAHPWPVGALPPLPVREKAPESADHGPTRADSGEPRAGDGRALVDGQASVVEQVPRLDACLPDRFDLVLCQDAFYFLEPKAAILDRLRALCSRDGVLAVGHIHNREAANLSAGAGLAAAEMAALFPDGVVYDDRELTAALVEGRAPMPRPPGALRGVEAFAVACGPGLLPVPRSLAGGYTLPPEEAPLRRNPLYRQRRDSDGALEIAWPSERYRDEYAPLATYPPRFREPASREDRATAVRRRALVDLPERW